MIVVEKVLSPKEIESVKPGCREDSLTLPWEERCKSHAKRTTDQGVSFGMSLPSGSSLKEGDSFYLEESTTLVTVREAPEEVYCIRPTSPQEWSRYAYEIGNRHQLVMITDSELVCLQNPATKNLFDQLKLNYSKDTRPFQPVRAVSGHSH